MRRAIMTVAAAAMLVGASGCATSRLVGTWKSERALSGEPAAGFDFAAVTFAPDGTYTAEMVYAGKTRAQSGTWELESDGELEIGPEPEREYEVTFDGPDRLTFEAEGVASVNMVRYKGE